MVVGKVTCKLYDEEKLLYTIAFNGAFIEKNRRRILESGTHITFRINTKDQALSIYQSLKQKASFPIKLKNIRRSFRR